MGAYQYRAVDTSGREKKGLLEGDTARSVRQALREKQLLPIEVTEVAERGGKKKKEKRGGLSLGNSLSATELALITRQLATACRASSKGRPARNMVASWRVMSASSVALSELPSERPP
ncbi:MAG: type II secretion system protein GspF, partial [Pseudomonadota bacterium]